MSLPEEDHHPPGPAEEAGDAAEMLPEEDAAQLAGLGEVNEPVPPDDPHARLLEKVRSFPDLPGVYLWKDQDDHELYVGKAKSLRKRVKQYLDLARLSRADAKVLDLLQRAADVTYVQCESEVEAFFLENRLIKDLQPMFNARLRSQVDFPVVEITWSEPFPQVIVTRDRSNKDSHYYGPFVSASRLRNALMLLQRVFKFRSCSLDLDENEKRWRYYRPCLEYYIGRCQAPCNLRQTKEAYRTALRRLAAALSGRVKELVRELESEMRQAAQELRFEAAAELRDMVQALVSLDARGDLSDETLEPAVLHIDPREGCEKLRQPLGLPASPRVIEGLDVAHLQGRQTVGALVSFIDGAPNRAGYRRFKVRAAAGADDYAALREVVARRYGRLYREGLRLPEVILIDGGLGQLQAAAGVLRQAGIAVPCLAALAKREEAVYTLAHPEGIRLPRTHLGLKLLQYVRNEAHRFAQHYHHILRRKRIMGEGRHRTR